MREVFHDELRSLAEQLTQMSGLVSAAMASATQALLEGDLSLAESVISADAQIDAQQRHLDDRAVALLARESPVATDLRVVVSALRMSTSLERMGDLARHVASQARLRHPQLVVPESLVPTMSEMGDAAARIATAAGTVITTRDLDLAAQVERDDDRLDELHRSVFTAMQSPDWHETAERTIDVTLCSRYFERFGDHAVSVVRRVGFLVTGDVMKPVQPVAS
ncbi:phosphate signaling complex protein PhoU [Pseudokineococcus basanitobsidens]|uniref:Phosphate-specific transport system accessory protein PhoU n=1 Tax=Pseudokineococcus basanitobsidens TaxID=1926649 RepID=A0ABU8RGL0_9ACTN